uniref:Uncharacterized protein n=1 Tax=Cannabis sativa TaxID=3483 RepID=A0A803NPV4_CANSA
MRGLKSVLGLYRNRLSIHVEKQSKCVDGGFDIWSWAYVEMGTHLLLRSYFAKFCAVGGFVPFKFIHRFTVSYLDGIDAMSVKDNVHELIRGDFDDLKKAIASITVEMALNDVKVDEDSLDCDGLVIISRKRVADYDKWDEPFPHIFNRVEVVERLHPKVGTDLVPFLSNLLDLSATTSCKLGADKFSMMGSGDPIYVENYMRNKDNVVSLMVKRNCALINKNAYKLELLRSERINLKKRRDKAAKAPIEVNAKIEVVIKQRVKESLDKVIAHEKKENKEYNNDTLTLNNKIVSTATLEKQIKHYLELQQIVEQTEKDVLKKMEGVEVKLSTTKEAFEKSKNKASELENQNQ